MAHEPRVRGRCSSANGCRRGQWQTGQESEITLERMNMGQDQDLDHIAYLLAEEIRDGRWDHVEALKTKPVPSCPEIMEELERRCPGHTWSVTSERLRMACLHRGRGLGQRHGGRTIERFPPSG